MKKNLADELYFHEEADTFNLNITYHHSRLFITLKDFLEWSLYEKVYTEDDLGKEIHRKMDLIDVYSAFSQSKPSEDENSDAGLGVSRVRQY